MNFDTNKLRGRIVEKYGSLQNFSKHTGFKYSTLQNKLRSLTYFNQYDIVQMMKFLEISNEEVPVYFFREKV